MNVRRRNFWTAILGSGLCVILIGAISLLSVDSASDYFKSRPSTFFSDRTGTRALLLILQQVIPATSQWRRPFGDLPLQTNAAASTLVVMGPDEPLTESEAAILDKWIAAGGQMILAASKEGQIRKPLRSGERTNGKRKLKSSIRRDTLQGTACSQGLTFPERMRLRKPLRRISAQEESCSYRTRMHFPIPRFGLRIMRCGWCLAQWSGTTRRLRMSSSMNTITDSGKTCFPSPDRHIPQFPMGFHDHAAGGGRARLHAGNQTPFRPSG